MKTTTPASDPILPRLKFALQGGVRRVMPGLLPSVRGMIEDWRHPRAHFEGAPERFAQLAREIGERPFSEIQQAAFKSALGSEQAGRMMLASSVIEINNTCNIDCLMCKTSLSTRKKGMMPKELLELSVAKIVELGGRNVELHTIGDPLANPRLGDVLAVLRSRSVRTGLLTNGLLLGRYVDVLAEYVDVCSVLSVSIDGATKQTYERIRAGGNWEQLLAQLELAREKLVPKGYRLRVAICVSRDNVGEIGQWVERFRPYVKRPYFDMLFGIVNSLSPDNEYFEATNLFPAHTYVNAPCSQVSQPVGHTLIDGRVTVCCRDYDGSLVIGDVQQDSLAAIFKSKAMKAMQDAHAARDLSAYPLCATCYTVDSRVSGAFAEMMNYLLYFHPSEPAAFYQERVDRFVAAFQAKAPASNVSALFPAP